MFLWSVFFSGHAVDHDVGEGVPATSPHAEAEAVELKSAEPLTSFGDRVRLQKKSRKNIILAKEDNRRFVGTNVSVNETCDMRFF